MKRSMITISLLFSLFFIFGCTEPINKDNEPIEPPSFSESDFIIENVNDNIWKVKSTLVPIRDLNNISISFTLGHDLEFVEGEDFVLLENLNLEKEKKYAHEYSFVMPSEGCQRFIFRVGNRHSILFIKSIYVSLNEGEVNLIDAVEYQKLSEERIC